MRLRQDRTGFTIVELLIVIVVIGILATITIVAYNGIQNQARQAKIKSDLTNLKQAISLAQVNTGLNLAQITGGRSYGNGGAIVPCANKGAGADLSQLPQTDGCWVAYLTAIDKISVASGVNVHGLVDPWGRPYYVWTPDGCGSDGIAAYPLPFAPFVPMSGTIVYIDKVNGCQ